MIGEKTLGRVADAARLERIVASAEALLSRDPLPEGDRGSATQLRRMLTDMAATGSNRNDPMREIFARLGDKWSTLLLLLLEMRDLRHSSLRRLVGLVGSDGEISQRMLTLRLRSLERDGLVVRRELPVKPRGVAYSLTDIGRGLLAQHRLLMAWTREHLAEIRVARARFDGNVAASRAGATR